MAEIVQQVIESSIQELAILEKYNLFNSDEIKSILKRRREFEYRLRKVKKTKDDFLRYISYEESLLKLIRIRRDKSGLEIDRNEIEKNVLDHIKNLFEFTINKFKADINLWLSYIDFCKSQNQLDHVSIIYFRMLQIHNKDWLWIQFAKFEFEEKASSETTRKLFFRAVSFHSDSKQIWREYFRFELLYCSKMRKRFKILSNAAAESDINEVHEKQSNDAIWNGQLATIVYNHAVDHFADFEFAASFVEICYKFDPETIMETKKNILEDLQTRFGCCEEYWNLIAIDNLQTYRQTIRYNITPSTDNEQLKLKQNAYNQVIATYEKACFNFNNAKMWSFYISFRLSDLGDATELSVLIVKISEIIFTMEKLWKENKVTKEIFREWLKLMYSCKKKDSNSVQKIRKLLNEAADRWPEDCAMHLFIACIMTKLPDKRTADSVIEKFFHDSLIRKFIKVDESNVQIITDFWQLYIDWAVMNKAPYHKVMKILKQLNDVCMKAPRIMADDFKSKTLGTLYHVFGIEKVRLYYEQNKTISPICQGFSYKMIEIEEHHSVMQEEGSPVFVSRTNALYEDLVQHFGSESDQIWFDYIRHVMSADPSQVGVLYERALRALKSNKCQQFVQRYLLLKSSPSFTISKDGMCTN